MLSFGIEYDFAFSIAFCSARLLAGSPPPSFAATMIARESFEKSLPRFASAAPFLCLIDDHLLCPDNLCLLATVSRNLSCSRVSSVSSGWNAATRNRPSRASTGRPSTSASTSTFGPTSSTHGARMNTARSGVVLAGDVEVGLERRDLPAEGVAAHLTSTRPRWSRSSTIIPAQVPKTGRVECGAAPRRARRGASGA